MILVLFLCLILFIIIFLFFSIISSTIRFRIEDFEIANIQHTASNYKVIISFWIFNKIKWLSLNLNDNKMKKIYNKIHLEKIDIRKIEKDFKFADLKEFLNINAKITHFNLKLIIGVDSVILTSYIVPIICSLISIILPRVTKKKDIKNIKYKIEPVYNMKNVYHLKITTTVEIKIIKLLNSVYNMYKSKKNKKDKTSVQTG